MQYLIKTTLFNNYETRGRFFWRLKNYIEILCQYIIVYDIYIHTSQLCSRGVDTQDPGIRELPTHTGYILSHAQPEVTAPRVHAPGRCETPSGGRLGSGID